MQQKKKLSRKVISYALALLMVFSTITGMVPGTSISAQAKTYSSGTVEFKNLKVGDILKQGVTLKCGSYTTDFIYDKPRYKKNNALSEYNGSLYYNNSGSLTIGANGSLTISDTTIITPVNEYGLDGTEWEVSAVSFHSDVNVYQIHIVGKGGSSKVNVSSVELNKTEITLIVGGEETLQATVSPSEATDKTVAWKSSDTNVATVNNTGKVTAVGTGTATITATATNGTVSDTNDDKTATCTVTVEPAYTALTEANKPTISVSDNHDTPQIGDTLTAATTATDITYSWHYSDSDTHLGTESTYAVKKEDLGKQIVVTATQNKDESGDITGDKPTQTSEATTAVVKKTPATIDTNTAKTNAGISYSDEKAEPTAGYEISTDGSTPATLKEGSLSLTSILDGDTPKIYVRTAATEDTAAGAWVEVALASRPAAPTDLTTNNADNKTSANGKINGVDTTKEYSPKGGNTWTPVQGTTIDNLNPGVYLVRTKATADAPAGKTTEVKVGSKENILEDGQKPEAKSDLVYTSEEQSLVNAPADKLPEWADKLQYAIGTDETTKPEVSAYTDAIPTGSDSGTYYVWYRVYVDDNNTSDPTLITVEISPVDKAELNKAIEEAEDYYNTIKDNPAYSEQAKALDEAIKDTKELAKNKNAKDTEVSAGIIAVTEAKKKAEAEVKDIDDTAAAKKVIDAINALPASNKVVTTDKAAIEAVRKEYDALTADQKKKVPADVLKKLADAETALKAAEKDAADKTAADKVIEAINKLPANDKVATTDKAAIEAARKAYNSLTAEQKKNVPADVLKKLTDDEKALAAATAAEKAAKELEAAKEEAQAAMNEQVTVTQKGNKFTVKWKKSTFADGYYVYAQYCGKKVTKPVKTITKNTTTKTTISKIGGKKINQKKQFKVYVAPYKIIDGKKVTLGKSTVAHVVGAKNTKYSNVKKLTLKKTKYSVKVGKTAKIKAKVTLVNKNKKHIPKGHGAKFRYKSSDTSIATVDKNGKIKGIKKGTCTIYVYSINGLVKKAKVTVQ